MKSKNKINLAVIVAALGYFVDVYDLLLFGIVRVSSIKSMGVPDEKLFEVGIYLINSQMAGLLIGGVIWGILGDKRGRLSVLFGSIFLYSMANIVNAFVTTPDQYAIVRFIAGIGLAGELGAAITLVSEIMDKELRGIGTTIVASAGLLGGVFAGIVGDILPWNQAYILGGVMGLFLLILRVRMFESGLYDSVKNSEDIVRGDLFMLFRPRPRMIKYISCIVVGIPIWFVIGILMTFSPELAKELNVEGPIKAGTSILISYIGLSVGDLSSGLLSQFLKSRKKVIFIFLVLTTVGIILYVNSRGVSTERFYGICGYLGFCVGYWAVFITMAAEHFGTNLRSTAATTVPNFVRGAVVPLTLSFQALHKSFSLNSSALIVGITSVVLAVFALSKLSETFGRDLDFLERSP